MDSATRLCSECSIFPAELLCACTVLETFLCKQCFLEHSKKKPSLVHPTCPVSALLSRKDPNYVCSQEAFATNPPLQFPETHLLPLKLLTKINAKPAAPALQRLVPPPKTYFGSDEETPESAEKHYLESIQIFSVHFPLSLKFGECLNNLGRLYLQSERFERAEEQLLKSYSLLETCFPESEENAECSVLLGKVYAQMQQWEKSKEYYLRAISRYSTHHPQSWDFAFCLFCFGNLCRDIGQLEEAKANYLRSAYILIDYHPQNNRIIILKDLGSFYKKMQQYEDAEVTYLRVVSANSTRSDYLPRSLQSLRNIYRI